MADILRNKFIRRFLITLGVLLGLVLIFQYVFLPVFLRHKKVQEKILEMISQETQGTVQFSDLRLGVFPSLSFQIKGLVYESKDQAEPLLFEAGLVKARLELFSIFGRNIKLKDLTIKNASIKGKTRFFSNRQIPFEFNGFSVEARGIRKRSLGSLRARGKLFSDEDNFEITGSLRLGDVANLKLEDVLCDLLITLDEVPMEPILIHRLNLLPLRIIGGKASGTVQVIKKTRARNGEWSTKLAFQDVMYADPNDPALSFPTTSQNWISRGSWNADTGKLSIYSSKLEAEGIEGELLGDFSITDRGLQDFDAHVAFRKYDFKQADIHFPFLGYWFRTGMEVEGEGEIRFQTKGNFNAFTFQGELILDDASINYEYFQKAKETPLSLKADVRLDNKTTWSGKFDFRYKEMKIKGALLEFKPEAGDLEFTILTNKFHLDSFFEATASTNEKCIWEGDLKLLLHYKGKMAEPEEASIQGVINLDSIAYRLQGVPFRTPPLHAVLKIEDQEMYSEDSYFEFADQKAPFELQWKGWESPRLWWKATAGVIDLKPLLVPQDSEENGASETSVGLSPYDLQEEKEPVSQDSKDWDMLPPWLENLKAIGEIQINEVTVGKAPFRRVKGTMTMEKGKWALKSLGGKGAGGELWLEAEQDLRFQQVPRISVYGKRLRLDELFGLDSPVTGMSAFKIYNVRNITPENILRGNLLIQRGSVKNLRLLEAVSSVMKKPYGGGIMEFTDLGIWFRAGEKEIDFGEIVIESKKTLIKSRGKWTREGEIYFEGLAVLGRDISQDWMSGLGRGERLSVPFKVEGDVEEPRVLVDPKSIQTLLEKPFRKEVLGRLDYLRFLDRQSPKYMRLPDRARFLQVTEKKERKVKRKGGFFEILFGRRR